MLPITSNQCHTDWYIYLQWYEQFLVTLTSGRNNQSKNQVKFVWTGNQWEILLGWGMALRRFKKKLCSTDTKH